MPSSSVEEKIRALLRLANDAGASEHEASLAMERAHELLLKHNLDMMEVEAGEDDEVQQVVEEEFDYRYADRWRPSLVNVVAKHNYCRVINRSKRGSLQVIGRTHNVVATKEMSRWLMGQVADLTRERWGIEANVLEQTGDTREQDWKDGFAYGIITRLKERLAEQKAMEEGRDSNVRALVVDLSSETNSFINRAYPGGLTSRTVRFDGAAYNVGVRAADGVSISPEGRQVGGERKLIG
ncbi:hypothetical protein LCGC14_0799800 [marine sediment metagenome]|uniref:Uncharacterized protein n=1 Tax=marine sediment metagenome TaxID=412755 RepID=A0A0F9SA36_9ZZZZ